MKRCVIFVAILLFTLISTLCACSSHADLYEEDMGNVQLVNFAEFDIVREAVSVSDDDLNEAIQAFLEMNAMDKEDFNDESDTPAILTDEIAVKYGYGSAKELVSYIRITLIKNRYFEELYYKIINESAITGNLVGLKKYLDEEYDRKCETAREVDLSLEDYLKDAYGCSENEYIEASENFYYEMITVGSLAHRLNLYPTKTQYDDWISSIAEVNQVTPESIKEVFGKEYLIFSFNYEQIRAYFMENIPPEYISCM